MNVRLLEVAQQELGEAVAREGLAPIEPPRDNAQETVTEELASVT